MSALMADIADGTVKPSIANAIVNAGSKLLRIMDLERRYGQEDRDGSRKLNLTRE